MKHFKWLAFLTAAVMLLCAVPQTSALAATGTTGECVSPDGTIYRTHSWGPWRTEKEATCRETGVRVRVCQHCRATQRETIPTTGHSYGAWTVTEPATCAAEGEQTRKCSVCGLVHTRAIPKDPDAHVFGAWETVKAPTKSEEGLMRRVCTLCGFVQEETIPPDPDAEGITVTPSPEPDAGDCAIALICAEIRPEKNELLLLIQNTGEQDLTNITLDVQLRDEEGVLHMVRQIEPNGNVIQVGANMSFVFAWTAGQEADGFSFVAAANGLIDGKLCTAHLKVDIPPEDEPETPPADESYTVTLTKEAVSTPPEGHAAYRNGDNVTYRITVINSLPFAIVGNVYDQIVGYGQLTAGTLEVPAGATGEMIFNYTVGDEAADGSVTDVALFEGITLDPSGDPGYVYGQSDPVTIYTEEINGTVDEGVTLLKERANDPVDPKGYALNETVKFTITVHNGYNFPITGTLWDQVSSLKDPTPLPSFSLAPGESTVVDYSYDVRQEDVDQGYFENVAYAEIPVFTVLAGVREQTTVWSNVVRVDVIRPQPRITPEPEPVCRRVLKEVSGEGGVYECTFCRTHLAVENKARALDGAEAKAVWTAAVNGLYDDLAAKYPGGTAQLAENDRKLFFAQLDLYESALAEAYGAAAAAEMVLDELRDRCIDLCYALHTAPQKRTDSVLRSVSALNASGTLPGECVRTRQKNSGGFTLKELLCANHGYIGYVPEAASPGETEFAWTRRLWEAALTTEVAVLRGAVSAKAKVTVSESLKAFLAWTEARGELLKALYDDGAVVQEILVFTVRGRTMDLERAKE